MIIYVNYFSIKLEKNMMFYKVVPHPQVLGQINDQERTSMFSDC